MKILKKFFLLIALVTALPGLSQTKKIFIEKAEQSFAGEGKLKGATVLLGNVKMRHEGARLTCQKALYYKEQNFFKAIGKVVIKQGDTITQTSDYSDYDANSKQALSWGNVVLKDPTMTLTSDTLHFDRVRQKLYYNSFATIKDPTNTLKSKKGNYYLESKKFTATHNVTVVNPDHRLVSNHLDYYTNSGVAYLYGPSTITNTKDKNKIYAERGFHNTKTNISYFIKNAKLFLKQRTIEGDSLYYDKNRGFASATKNIVIKDTVENFITRGGYAELFEKKDSLFIIKKAVAISLVEKDSLFVHGDTLLVTGKAKNRIINTYHNVKIFKLDLQGKCDSLETNQATGITKMFYNPVLWSDKSQITGDSIHLLRDLKTDKLDSLKVLSNAFIIQKDSLSENNFNQIKGRNMYGKFTDSKLKHLLVKGNAEVINFNRNEQQVLESITKQLCSNIEFDFENGQVIAIKCLKKSDGKTHPPSQLNESERKLKDFRWREAERPRKMEAIFIKDSTAIPLKKIAKPVSKKNNTSLALPKKKGKRTRRKKGVPMVLDTINIKKQ